MEWQEFLNQEAINKGLSQLQKNTLLAIFPDAYTIKDIQQAADDLFTSKGNLQNNILKPIYQSFETDCPDLKTAGRGKAEILRKYLYDEYKKLESPPPPKKFPYPIEFRSLIETRTKRFVGRDFVFAAFEKFIEDNDKGYFTVIGEPGTGKSAIAANFVVRNQVPCYFNIASNGNNTPDQFLHSIRQQLIDAYNLHYAEKANLSTILELVKNSLSPEQRLIILVDALDEVDQERGQENILYLPKNLPDYVCFFLTRRHYNNQEEKRLFTEIDTPQLELDLRNMEYQQLNKEDVKKCLYLFLDQDPVFKEKLAQWLTNNNYQREGFVNLVGDKVGDNFMYLVCLMDALIKPEYAQFDLNQLPPKLEEYYDLHWRRMGMTKTENLLKVMILYLIKEVREKKGQISAQTIANILKTNIDQVESVLNDWFQYFRVTTEDNKEYYDFYHYTFLEYFKKRKELNSEREIFKEVNQRLNEYNKQNKPSKYRRN